MRIFLGFDAETLREKIDRDEAERRLTELESDADSTTVPERIGLLRLVGRLDEALALADESLAATREHGDPEQVVQARLRRAHVLQFRGDHDAALTEIDECIALATEEGWRETEAMAYHHRGRLHFEQGETDDALQDFHAATAIRERTGASPALIESSRYATRVVEARLEEEEDGEAWVEENHDQAGTDEASTDEASTDEASTDEKAEFAEEASDTFADTDSFADTDTENEFEVDSAGDVTPRESEHG